MAKQKKPSIPPEIKSYIDEVAKKTAAAVSDAYKPLQQPQNAKAAFKNTEARLYALPVLKVKIKDDEEKIEELRTYGTPARSKSITRFSKSSTRMDPVEAIIKDKQACIESDQHEVDVLEEALEIIKPDPYYESVSGRYFEGLDNEAIAESLGCDATTVWRNRQRLIKSLSVRLYGTAAID